MKLLKKKTKKCLQCSRDTLLSYEYESTCNSCGYNVIKRKHELTKIQTKRINFVNRLNYSEKETFCICIDVYKIIDGNDTDKIYEVLSTLKIKKVKINNILIEKYKYMIVNTDFGQNHYSRTDKGIHKFVLIVSD